MLIVANRHVMLSVVMLNFVMLSVHGPEISIVLHLSESMKQTCTLNSRSDSLIITRV
jgi:hypothetical protein